MYKETYISLLNVITSNTDSEAKVWYQHTTSVLNFTGSFSYGLRVVLPCLTLVLTNFFGKQSFSKVAKRLYVIYTNPFGVSYG